MHAPSSERPVPLKLPREREQRGGLGDAGVPPEHKSDRNRQPSVLSPAPALSAAWGSSSATSTSLPHTLERRGYTGTEEECSETESWPMLDTVD
jgi:hypothetical protein